MSLFRVVNIIDYARDSRQRSRDDAQGIMIHRVGVNLSTGVRIGEDGPGIVDAFLGRIAGFEEVVAATGGENAYTFFVGGRHGSKSNNGAVWQATPLWETTYHARRWSQSYIGIACIGDYRYEAPTTEQWFALTCLCGGICFANGWGPDRIVGHGDIPGAHGGEKSRGQADACPGELLPMNDLRAEVDKYLHTARDEKFNKLGIVA